jgi:hypothetical protein
MRYNGPANDLDYAYALGVSPDGSKLFVTGKSFGSGGSVDYTTVAYDAATGAQLWLTPYDGPASQYDAASALRVSPDGSKVFVTGESDGPSSRDYATVAYDAANGGQLWVNRYDGRSHSTDQARKIGVSPDGSKVFVTGNSVRGSSYEGNDYATVAYDAVTGARLWVRRYDGPAHSVDEPADIGVSPDSSAVFVTGVSWGGQPSLNDYATVAYDAATGAQLWSSRYDAGYGGDGANALGVSSDGSTLFVTGASSGGSGTYDYATVAYSTG